MTETKRRDIIDVRMPDRRTKEKQVDPIRGTWPASGDTWRWFWGYSRVGF
jgi:hypothetical protein